MTLVQRQLAALAPVQDALLREATDRADQIVADAHADAEAQVAAARARAEDIMTRAAADGRLAATALMADERGRGRLAARSVLLDADRQAYDAVADAIRSAVCGLRDQPGYAEIRERLAGVARSTAGSDATVIDHPDGGVLARGPGITVDCSLPRLADLVVTALGPKIREVCGI